MMKALILSVALATFSLHACPPSPSVPDAGDAAPPDAGTEASTDAGTSTDAGMSVYDLACSNLKSLGCVEGNDPSCAAVLKKAQEGRVSDFDPPCLASKHTKEEVRACGRRNTKCP